MSCVNGYDHLRSYDCARQLADHQVDVMRIDAVAAYGLSTNTQLNKSLRPIVVGVGRPCAPALSDCHRKYSTTFITQSSSIRHRVLAGNRSRCTQRNAQQGGGVRTAGESGGIRSTNREIDQDRYDDR